MVISGPADPQACAEPEGAQIADVAGLQLALATGFSIYSLKETKKMELGGCLSSCLSAQMLGQAASGITVVPDAGSAVPNCPRCRLKAHSKAWSEAPLPAPCIAADEAVALHAEDALGQASCGKSQWQ